MDKKYAVKILGNLGFIFTEKEFNELGIVYNTGGHLETRAIWSNGIGYLVPLERFEEVYEEPKEKAE